MIALRKHELSHFAKRIVVDIHCCIVNIAADGDTVHDGLEYQIDGLCVALSELHCATTNAIVGKTYLIT